MKVWIVEVGTDYEGSMVIDVFDRRPSVEEILERAAANYEVTKYAGWMHVYGLEVRPIKNLSKCIDNPEMLKFSRQWSDGEATGSCGWKREA